MTGSDAANQVSVRLFFRKYRKQTLRCQNKKQDNYKELNTNPQIAFGQK